MKKYYSIIVLFLAIAAGCTDMKSVNPLTKNNAAPTLKIIGFASDTLVFVPGKVHTFEFIASDDADREPDIILKAIGGTGTITIFDTTAHGRYLANFLPAREGEHRIEISVSDGLETTSDILVVFFGDNQAPVAVITYREIVRDIPGLQFTYEFDAGSSTDRDSKIIKAQWNLAGVRLQASFNEKVTHTFNYYANYRIELTVEDEFGGTDSTSIIVDNSRPQALFTIRPGAETKNGDRITLDATSSISQHGSINAYQWFFRNADQGLNILTAGTESIFRYEVNQYVGENFIGLVVGDDGGNISDTTWVKLTVLNQAPQVVFSFSTARERITIIDNQSADKDPGDTITLSWFLDGSHQPDKDNESLPFFDVRGSVYQLTLTATDNHGDSSSTTKTVSVPGVPEAHFVFPGGVNDNFVTGNGQNIIIDGGKSIPGNESSGIETYTWFLRPEGQPIETLRSGSNSQLQLSVNHAIGNYEIGLKIINLEGLESVTTWKNMTVKNTNPTAEFTCEFKTFVEAIVYKILSNSSSDPDPNDPFIYKWLLDGIEQTNITDPTPIFTRKHSEAVSTITLQVTDSYGGTGEVSKSVNSDCSSN